MENRIYLKKFLSEDDFQYFYKLVSNEKVMALDSGRPFTLEEAKNYFRYLLKNNERHEDFGNFKVFESAENIFIGLGALVLNDDFTEAEIEYSLLPEYWAKGYGSEIVEKLLKKTEVIESIEQITATIDPNNMASKKILIKNGFVSQEIFKIDDGSLAETFSKKIVQPRKLCSME